MQLEINGREQASALSKEQVAPSGAAGGGRLGNLAPYLTRKSAIFNAGQTGRACLFAARGFGSRASKVHKAHSVAASYN